MNNKNKRGVCYDFHVSGNHNSQGTEAAILAVVRFIARRAAEKDYKELQRALARDADPSGPQRKEE